MNTELKRLTEVKKPELINLMNHPLVRRQMPLLKESFNESACNKFIAAKELLWLDYGYGPWAFFIEGRFAGWGGLQPEEGEADLAMVLHPDYWGMGKAIYKLIIGHAFNVMHLTSVTILFPPSTKFQLIDVKDLAKFGLHLINQHLPGCYNTVGPGYSLSFKDYLKEIHKATDNISKIYWADSDWLREKNVTPWNDLPNYIPMSDPEPGFYTISNDKGIRAGLTFRPVFTTIVESLGNLSIDQLRKMESANGMDENLRLSLISDWEGAHKLSE